MCSIMGYTAKDIRLEDLRKGFDKTVSRGPDMSRTLETPAGWLFFHRLAIMGLTEEGMQPFELDGSAVVCNGELYGFRSVKEELRRKGYTFKSDSDCEILLPLYKEEGTEMFKKLDAEFALIIYDAETDSFIAARDPIGIRPLYYGYSESGHIMFASEPKTSSACAIALCRSRRATTIRTANSPATATSPKSKKFATMISRLSVKTSMISSLPASKSGSMPMPRSAFFSAVGLIVPSSAPSRQSF